MTIDFAEVIRSRAGRIRMHWDAAVARGEISIINLVQDRDNLGHFWLMLQDLAGFVRDLPANQSALATHLGAFGQDETKVTILFILWSEFGRIEPIIFHVPLLQLETVQGPDVQTMRFTPGVH